MPAEGMVHALQTIHALLKPDGVLIDLHPTGEPPQIDWVHAGGRLQIGLLQEPDDFVEYFQSDHALETAQNQGFFKLERQAVFRFITRTEDYPELQAFLEENWSDAWLDPAIDPRAREAASKYPAGYVEMIENVHILRFTALASSSR